tara:strand:- start:1399 stop:1893 length:495 start_codon:yes stop_codon:yes gene_type:complete
MKLMMLLLLAARCSALLVPLSRPVVASGVRSVPRRSATVTLEETAEEKLTWNTAQDAAGETYYWNSAGASTYEKPADFDPATAVNSGVFKGEAGASGALYDDEMGDETDVTYTSGEKKPQLSNTMRDKLINEGRALGADPNAKSPFLPVFAAVGLLVVLGALTQ